jgi:predicted solute-binding protein
MARLAQIVGVESQPVSPFGPSVLGLLEEATEQMGLAETLYRDTKTSNRYAAARARMAVSLLMQAAQKMMREQQYAERMRRRINLMVNLEQIKADIAARKAMPAWGPHRAHQDYQCHASQLFAENG